MDAKDKKLEIDLINEINEIGKKYTHIKNIKELLPISTNDSAFKIDLLVGDIEFFTKDYQLLSYAVELLKLKQGGFGDL
jgi:hypothetical protein